jgi:tetratricopeptide (TPR) repeat protein
MKRILVVLLLGLSTTAVLSADYLSEAMTYYNQGNAYYEAGELDKAIERYTQAIRLNLNSTAAYIHRGFAYVMKEDYTRARADWEKALQLDPNDAQARKGIEALQRMGY